MHCVSLLYTRSFLSTWRLRSTKRILRSVLACTRTLCCIARWRSASRSLSWVLREFTIARRLWASHLPGSNLINSIRGYHLTLTIKSWAHSWSSTQAYLSLSTSNCSPMLESPTLWRTTCPSPQWALTSMPPKSGKCRPKLVNFSRKHAIKRTHKLSSKTLLKSSKFKWRVSKVKNRDSYSKIAILCSAVKPQSTSCSTWFYHLEAHMCCKTTMIRSKVLLTSAWTDPLPLLKKARNTFVHST